MSRREDLHQSGAVAEVQISDPALDDAELLAISRIEDRVIE